MMGLSVISLICDDVSMFQNIFSSFCNMDVEYIIGIDNRNKADLSFLHNKDGEIFYFDLKDISEAYNKAISLCEKDWIVLLDPDEYISNTNILQEIINEINATDYDSIKVTRKNYNENEILNNSDKLIRIFRNNKKIYFYGKIAPELVNVKKVYNSKLEIEHFPYTKHNDLIIERANIFKQLKQEELLDNSISIKNHLKNRNLHI